MPIKLQWHKRTRLALVFGGGGARGALQVGAVRALLEAGIRPDLLVGTSAGALNAAFLALRGLTSQGLASLALAWRDAAVEDLLPANYLTFTMRLLSDHGRVYPDCRIRDFYIRHGLTPEIRFGDVVGPSTFVVAADIDNPCPVLYGTDAKESVLEALVAATALPPWIYPTPANGRLVLDGGVLSNLPIEPALSLGATKIIALDVDDLRITQEFKPGLGAQIARLTLTAQQREKRLELALAKARRVVVHQFELAAERPVAFWDFGHAEELFDQGYESAREQISALRLDRYG